jgi:hypothetical protein
MEVGIIGLRRRERSWRIWGMIIQSLGLLLEGGGKMRIHALKFRVEVRLRLLDSWKSCGCLPLSYELCKVDIIHIQRRKPLLIATLSSYGIDKFCCLYSEAVTTRGFESWNKH